MRNSLRFFATCCGLLLALVCGAGCSKKEEPAEVERPAEAPEGPQTGVGDVIDYAIGKKQIETGRRMERKLDRIQQQRQKQLEEMLGEE